MAEDPANVELDKFSSEDPGHVAPPGNRRSAALLAIAGVLILALAGGYWFLQRTPSAPDSAAEKKPSASPPATQADSGDQIRLPPLEETDPLVRELVGRLSSHPAVAAWLTTDDLLMNFVMVTTSIAKGETPAGELKKVGPIGRLRTRTSRDNIYLDPASYHRYDRFGDAVSALDARGVARLYTTLKPRAGDGYAKLGGVGAEFDHVLERAIVELLRVPVVEGDVLLQPKGIGYAFADDRLERMSAAQKQFLRMGPQNVRLIQRKLREIAFQLAIPESRLPPA